MVVIAWLATTYIVTRHLVWRLCWASIWCTAREFVGNWWLIQQLTQLIYNVQFLIQLEFSAECLVLFRLEARVDQLLGGDQLFVGDVVLLVVAVRVIRWRYVNICQPQSQPSHFISHSDQRRMTLCFCIHCRSMSRLLDWQPAVKSRLLIETYAA